MPTTPSPINNCGDGGHIGTIQQQITNIASKFSRDGPEQLLRVLIASFVKELKKDQNAIYSRLDDALKIPATTTPQHIPQQPTWSTIAAFTPQKHPHLQLQGPTLAASTALKSPPQYYKRELIAHCNKTNDNFDRPAQRLFQDLTRATI